MLDRLPSPHIVNIPVGDRCNNRCTFCMERSRGNPSEVSFDQHLASLARLGSELDGVIFTCGEPTLEPRLPELIGAARRFGYRRISLVTNGRALSNLALAERLLAAGLSHVTVSLHGVDAKVHDAIVRRPGAFAQTLAGMKNLVALSKRYPHSFDVNCTLVRDNLASMRALRDLALEVGARAVNFNVVEPRGTADDLFDGVVPSYTEVMDHADRSGLDFGEPAQSLARVPPCAGGAEWVQETFHLALPEGDDVYDSRQGKVKGPPCTECAASGSCDGIWERYATGFGWGELVPLVDPAARSGQTLRLRTGSPCNNRCASCVDGPAALPAAEPPTVGRQLRDGFIQGYRRVELAGGEALLGEQAEAIVREARRLRYRQVTLETNARVLNLPERMDRLRALGLDQVVVRLNAGDEQTHDEMARVSGAFRQTVRGMLELSRLKIPYSVRLRRHPRNLASLDRARQLALGAGALGFEVVEPR